MKTHRFGVLAALAMSLFAFCFAPSPARADQLDPALQKVQGTWRIVAIRDTRKPPSPEQLKEMKLVIEGNKMTLFGSSGRLEENTITLATSSDQKSMDIHHGPDTCRALYSLTDKGMLICFDKSLKADRPREIPTGDTVPANLTILVLERA